MLQYNRFTGAAPSGFADMGDAWPIELCFNQLDWVHPAHMQCEYRVPMCDELYRTSKDDADGATAWYYDANAQCKRCSKEATRDFILILLLVAVCAPLGFLGGKLLNDPDLAPIASARRSTPGPP